MAKLFLASDQTSRPKLPFKSQQNKASKTFKYNQLEIEMFWQSLRNGIMCRAGVWPIRLPGWVSHGLTSETHHWVVVSPLNPFEHVSLDESWQNRVEKRIYLIPPSIIPPSRSILGQHKVTNTVWWLSSLRLTSSQVEVAGIVPFLPSFAFSRAALALRGRSCRWPASSPSGGRPVENRSPKNGFIFPRISW